MITITRKEEVVFNQIKIFDVEYDGIIPLDALKKELCSGSFHEYDLVQVLNSLSNKNVVKFEDSNIKLLVSDKKICLFLYFFVNSLKIWITYSFAALISLPIDPVASIK